MAPRHSALLPPPLLLLLLLALCRPPGASARRLHEASVPQPAAGSEQHILLWLPAEQAHHGCPMGPTQPGPLGREGEHNLADRRIPFLVPASSRTRATPGSGPRAPLAATVEPAMKVVKFEERYAFGEQALTSLASFEIVPGLKARLSDGMLLLPSRWELTLWPAGNTHVVEWRGVG